MSIRQTIHRNLPLHIAVVAIIGALFWLSSAMIGADFARLIANVGRAGGLVSRMLSPNWDYLLAVLPALAETVQMALAGTTIGAAMALPVSFLATKTITGSHGVTIVVRSLLNLIRTIPEVLAAALLVALVGIGAFTGMLAIVVFTFGFISKLFYESIESIDEGTLEAMAAVGATRAQVAVHAVIPSLLPNIVSYTLYVLEINVRSSIVLGMVGAGGVGVPLQSAMALARYDRVVVIVLAVFVVVLIIDALSAWARRRLL